jgi:hypothetical protein
MSKQIHVSHASCDHDKTPKARAVCRRIRRGNAPETSKAEIVARVKDKKSNKRAKVPVLRELLTLVNDDENMAVNLESFMCNDLDCEGHATQDDADHANALIAKHAPACEQDDVKQVNVNVIAKGSKVVHMSTGSDDAMLFACTKRPINVDSAKITTNDVTCKNCLKITK